MKNNLEILIEEYQKQCTYLKLEITEAIEERDYGMAEKFDKVLRFTQKKLKVLEKFKNPHEYRIGRIRSTLSNWQIPYEWKDNLFVEEMYKSRKLVFEEELESLLEYNAEARINTDVILDCLNKMYQGEIKIFSIEIESYYKISHRLIGEILQIEISPFDDESTINISSITGLNHLKGIGFMESVSESLVYCTNFDQTKVHDVLEVISTVFYDGLILDDNYKAIIRY